MSASSSVTRTAVRPAVQSSWFRDNLGWMAITVALVALPFVLAILNGQSPAGVLAGEGGNAKFIQGLMIEIFILGIYAISYDLLLGVTGLLSFGHAMFFAVGAYFTGIALKSFGWPFPVMVAAVICAGVLQALLFGIVLPRVHGVTFALVTLGFASVFEIALKSREFADLTGADVGLQGIPKPAFLDPANERFRFYLVALAALMLTYLIYRRFVNSPTGRVAVAIRENEQRARMLGYNTFYFKLAVLCVSSIAAALAGMLHALYMPLVSPHVASLGFTVTALLMILMGGIGTLSGALLGAALFRLMEFYFSRWFGENAAFLIGAVYVLLVLFVPYGIVGTWRRRAAERKTGLRELARLATGGKVEGKL
ncbi:MAG: branched-chain amino acid ABC transporter permease [Caldilineaceae bacterium]|nr:branched-chain amino acid ABC transporter permease [Caldilineaceae bacterium]